MSDYLVSIQQSQKSVRVMLVDDDGFYRKTLTTLLEEAGMQVIGLNDGKEALKELEHTRPDVILLDYLMPELNGIETLKQIKSNPDTKSIPIIMLTGVHEPELVDASFREGADNFIAKQSGRTAILKKIDEAING